MRDLEMSTGISESDLVRQQLQALLDHPDVRNTKITTHYERIRTIVCSVPKADGTNESYSLIRRLFIPVAPNHDPTVTVDEATVFDGGRFNPDSEVQTCDFLTASPETLAEFSGVLQQIHDRLQASTVSQ